MENPDSRYDTQSYPENADGRDETLNKYEYDCFQSRTEADGFHEDFYRPGSPRRRALSVLNCRDGIVVLVDMVDFVRRNCRGVTPRPAVEMDFSRAN